MKINTYENRLLSILFLCFGFVFFDRLALSYLFPFIAQDLQLTNSHLGILSSALSVTWALSGMTLGHIADKKDSKKLILVVSVIAFTLCSVLSGIVTSFVSLLFFRSLMGVAEGPVLPVVQSLMASASNPKRRGLNMGLINASAPGLIGAVIAPVVLVWIATEYGWRSAFYATIIPGLVVAALIMLFVKNKYEHPNTEPMMETDSKTSIKDLLKHRNIVLCTIISCVYVSWFVTIITFTPTYLIKARALSPDVMSGIMGALGIAWMLWGFVVSFVSDRIGRKPAMIFFTLVTTAFPLVLIFAETDMILPLAFITYTGLGCFTLFMATIPAETVSPRQVATALGLIMGVGELVGGFITPIIAGVLADQYGLDVVMWIGAGTSFTVVILSLFLQETAPAVISKQEGKAVSSLS
ncbi:MFS transporter [Marinomonas sp. THO17]|uniref:MFS transporter n=1 Tax=Marinomonas sp. THO17 TaxID=3149048 RepID=UPI00336BEFB1